MRTGCTFSLILVSSLVAISVYTPGLHLLATAFQVDANQPTSSSMSFPTGRIPTATTWSQYLDSVRQLALAHTQALPDFVCTQKTKRMAKLGETGEWKLVDQIVAEVSYYSGKEHYKILTIDNRPPTTKADVKIAGFLSEGDFGNSLFQLFAPESNTSFSLEGSERVNKRITVRVRYYIPKTNSKFYIGLGAQKLTTAYGGRFWVDLASQQVVRLESEARDIPRSFPVEKSLHSTEYDLVEIGRQQYWLPVRSSVYLQLRNSRYPVMYVKNDIEYTEYRKFGTEIRLIIDPK